MKKNKLFLVSVISTLVLGFSVIKVPEVTAGIFKSVKAPDYTAEFNESNKPVLVNNDGTSTIFTKSGYPLGFVYENCSSESGYHVVMNDDSVIKREDDEKTLGVQNIKAIFTGELFAKYGLKEDSYHIKKLVSGETIELLDNYAFNYIQFVAQGTTKVESIKLGYTCSENVDNIPEATNPIINNASGAFFNGLDGNYEFDDHAFFHVQPLGTNSITSVSINGYKLKPEAKSDVNADNVYKIVVGSNDVVDVETSLTKTPDFIVNTYSIDGNTGATTDLGPVTIPSSLITEVNDFLYKVSAPTVSGLTPNQDYIYVLKDESKTNKELSFYYSQTSGGAVASASTSLSGSGTESSPYLIKSPADWLYLVNNPGDAVYYKLTKSLDFTNYTKTLIQVGGYTAQLQYGSGGGNVPLEANSIPFNGKLDGNNCSIRNIKMSSNNSQNAYNTGLFGLVNKGVSISNLSLYGTATSANNYGHIGGLVSIAQGGSFENVNSYVETSHNNGANATNGSAGGLIGLAVLNNEDLVINNCANYKLISRKTSTKWSNDHMGGLVGTLLNTTHKLFVKNSSNFGDVLSTGGIDADNNQAYGAFAGGIVGSSYYSTKQEFENCANFGEVISGAYSGGICGYTPAAKVINCENYGHVSSKLSSFKYSSKSYSSNGTHAGGIFGYVPEKAVFEIQNTFNFGDVDADVQYAGGIGGYLMYPKMTNCANFGNVSGCTDGSTGGLLGIASTTVLSECANFGNVTSPVGKIGGLAGSIENKSGTLTCSHTSNFGKVTKTGDGTDCGGLVGYTYAKATFQYANNFGDVYSDSDIYTGGFTGRIGAVTGSSFEYCSNYSRVVSHGSATSGFVGYFSNTIGLTLSISNSTNSGKIVTTGNMCGGFLGQFMANPIVTVNNCINNAFIDGVDYVGGIAGQSQNPASMISNCTNNGDINGNTRVAGIVGQIVFSIGGTNDNGNVNNGSISGGAYTSDLYGQTSEK